MTTGTIAPRELQSLLTSNGLYACLDVRERGEFALGQIEGTTPLPRGTLESRVRTMVPSASVSIVICCDDGRRSALAATTLEAMGYAQTSILAGGIDAWRADGHPIIEGWGVRGKTYGERTAVREEVPQVTAEELAARRARGDRTVLVDVRTDEEYRRGHVPGALHVPGGELVQEAPGLPGVQESALVITCAGRTRGILGAAALRRAGMSDVFALLNGAMGWRLAGFELEAGAAEAASRAAEPSQWAQEATFRLAQAEGVRFLSVQELEALLGSDDPAYAVDVRLPGEFRAGHVPGSVSLPAGQFALMHENVIAIRNAPLVLLSDDEVRAVWAAAMCQGLGFPEVFVLKGGISGWTAAGHRLEEGDAAGEVFGLAEARREVPAMGIADLAAALERGGPPMILDVRGSGEFGLGHIPGARWLARGKLELGIDALEPDRSRPIVAVCDSGVRSALAARTLRSLGRQRVSYLDGGLASWQTAGLPTVDGLDGAAVTREEAQADVGSTLWTGALARTRADMEKYLAWEEALAHERD
jgi:rhodanese-related sulfurtransferase